MVTEGGMVTRRDNDAAELPPHLIPRTPRVNLSAAAIRAVSVCAPRMLHVTHGGDPLAYARSWMEGVMERSDRLATAK